LQWCNHCTIFHHAPDSACRLGRDCDVFRRPSAAALSRAGARGAAQVDIETLEVIASSGRIDLREALAWAAAHRAELRAHWARLSGDR
jgi:hypothetical protein